MRGPRADNATVHASADRPGENVPGIVWPQGRRFAFSIFDDTDLMTMENGPPVYEFLAELGFRTTKSVWPLRGEAQARIGGATCDDPEYAAWTLGLQRQGFEIGIHGASYGTATRDEWQRGMERFNDLYGHYPRVHANHADSLDSIYWGEQRVSGLQRLAYNVLTRYKSRGWQGERPESPHYWGDLCRTHITYVRNFVYGDVNTLDACPQMPYHDPERPLVNAWFASSEGPDADTFCHTISEANQERLEAEGGACIMYTHLAAGFFENGRLDPRFTRLMSALSERRGWFVPVSELLDYIQTARGGRHVISASERRGLERRWLVHKLHTRGTS